MGTLTISGSSAQQDASVPSQMLQSNYGRSSNQSNVFQPRSLPQRSSKLEANRAMLMEYWFPEQSAAFSVKLCMRKPQN